MSKCFEIIPLDTWFFRGSTPMESGMMNVVSIFPPPVSVIKGAFWTASCNEKYPEEIDVKKKYNRDLINGNIPFEVSAIFIKKGSSYYVPAPATWYYDSEKKITYGKGMKDISLLVAKQNEKMSDLGMISSAGDVHFVKAEKDSKSLSGSWIKLEFLKCPEKEFAEDSVLFSSDIYSLENRTNVALDENRKAKDGQLFSSSHIRLREEISLVVLFDKDIELPKEGKFLFGGEKRISKYKQCEGLKIDSADGEEYFSLVPVEATEESLNSIISSGKIYLTAGWDLDKKCHKPSINWIPAGAVFNKKINDSCIAINKQEK